MKAVILGLALAFGAASLAAPAYADDLSGARKAKSASIKKSKRVRAAPARQGWNNSWNNNWNNNWNQNWNKPYQKQRRERMPRQAAPAQGGRQGQSECSPDARRLCRSVLSQGDMAVLGCFKANVRRLSRPCSGFLRRMGQI